MAVRLYLQNAAAPYTPTTIRGTWDNAGATGASYLGPRPAGAATTAAIATGSTNADHDVVLRRFVSDPCVASGTLSGTATWIFGVLESNAAANAFLHLHVYVTAGDSDTVRGTLISDQVDTVTEWTITGTGRGLGAQPITSTAVQAGDRIVAVIGYRATADTTARTATLHYGNTGTTDLAQGGTGVTTAPGYIEFSGGDGIIYQSLSSLISMFATMPGFFSGNYGSIAPAVSGGRLQVQSNGAVTDDYSGAITDNTTTFIHFDATGVFVEVPTLPSSTGATTYSYASLQIIDSGNATAGTLAGISLNTKANTATFYIYSAYSDSGGGATSLTLDATNHRWIRIRRSGASLLWDTSPDGTTWTNRRTLASPASWVNYNKLDLLLECFKDAGGIGLTEYAHLNTLSTDATVTPVAVTAVVAVPVPAISVSATVTPGVIAASVAVPAPAPSAGTGVTPAAIAAVAAVPAPSVSTVTNANANAPVVAAVASVPTPALATGSAVTPSPVATATALPTPVVSGGATAVPGAVAAAAAVPAPALSTGATVTPVSVPVTAAVPVPTVGAVTVVSPAPVAAVASVPVPAVSAGATASPPPVAATAAVLGVSVSTGADAGVSAPVIAASVALPLPALASSSQVSPSPIAATAAVPSPLLSAGSTAAAATIAALAAVLTPGLSAGANATPSPITAVTAVPVPVVSGRVTVAASVIAAVAAVLAPVISSASLVAPQPIAATVTFPQVRVRSTTGGAFATTTETGSFVSSTSAGRFT